LAAWGARTAQGQRSAFTRVRSTTVDAHPEFRSQNSEFRMKKRLLLLPFRVQAIETHILNGRQNTQIVALQYSGFWILDTGFCAIQPS
jgi:hypothetical protein